MKLLVTGSAGFIGFHLTRKLLQQGYNVLGVDNLNNYYDPQLKRDRLEALQQLVKMRGYERRYEFKELDISDRTGMANLFKENQFDRVVHLAAQAGVRYSLDNPHAYIDSNIVGFMNVLEGCRHQKTAHLVYASSSSVYGLNKKTPFSTDDRVDNPISLYAATKKANELMAHTYSHLFALPTTGLRFFTVYGPWGRPDMAYYSFTKAILANEPIKVFNHGNMQRDFTYIDDIIEGLIRIVDYIPKPKMDNNDLASAPYSIYNIGNNNPITLDHFISTLENALGKSAIRISLPMQPGDVPTTYADVDQLVKDVDFKPLTEIKFGIQKFSDWYIEYQSKIKQ